MTFIDFEPNICFELPQMNLLSAPSDSDVNIISSYKVDQRQNHFLPLFRFKRTIWQIPIYFTVLYKALVETISQEKATGAGCICLVST